MSKNVRELKENEVIVGSVFMCKEKAILTTRTGKDYLSLKLWDPSGIIDAKAWDMAKVQDTFVDDDFVVVDGGVTSYQGTLQVQVKSIRKANENEYNVLDFIPKSKYDIEQMFSNLLAMVDSIVNPYLKTLLEEFFVKDNVTVGQFKMHSAAKSMHHNFAGGLLQHSLAVAKLCDFYATQYPAINRDLLITAALLHDIGKLKELQPLPANSYTDVGQLIGHVVDGAMEVSLRASMIPDFPIELRNELVHCILAHHGELEFGSPKKPATIEAVALAFADNTDAKIEAFTASIDSASEPGWLGFNKMFDTYIKTSYDGNN